MKKLLSAILLAVVVMTLCSSAEMYLQDPYLEFDEYDCKVYMQVVNVPPAGTPLLEAPDLYADSLMYLKEDYIVYAVADNCEFAYCCWEELGEPVWGFVDISYLETLFSEPY